MPRCDRSSEVARRPGPDRARRGRRSAGASGADDALAGPGRVRTARSTSSSRCRTSAGHRGGGARSGGTAAAAGRRGPGLRDLHARPDGHDRQLEPGAQRSKGWTADEIIGQHFRVFYPTEKQAERHPEHELELALRDGRYEEEGWRVRKDGSRFWAHVTITAVRGPGWPAGRVREGDPRHHRAPRGQRAARGGQRPVAPGRRRPVALPGHDGARAALAGGGARRHGDSCCAPTGPSSRTTSASSCWTA